MGNYRVVVLDFETTGLSPDQHDRVIEVGAVLVDHNRIVDRFQSLMNPGRRISSFIEQYTGITNEMVRSAPPIAEVISRFAEFMAKHPLVAHNASFDRRFLDAELRRIDRKRKLEFGCSMLVSRRLYPHAPAHNLAALVRYKQLPVTGVAHRALADAEMAAHLWISLVHEVKTSYRLREVPFALMQRLAKMPKSAVPAYLARVAAEQC